MRLDEILSDLQKEYDHIKRLVSASNKKKIRNGHGLEWVKKKMTPERIDDIKAEVRAEETGSWTTRS